MTKDTKTPENTTTALLDYTANADGWVAGRRVKKGDVLQLTARAAKYENVTRVSEKPTKGGAGK